jgi:hypothetical protein
MRRPALKPIEAMSVRIPIIGLTSLFLVFAMGFAWRGYRSEGTAQAAFTAFGRQRARLDLDLRQARDRMVGRQRETSTLEAKIERSPAPPAAAKITAANVPPPRQDPATLVASDPELRSLYLKSFRANLAQRYLGMYQSLGLSQAQIDKFEDLATAQADDGLTRQAAALAQGLTLSDPGLADLQKESLAQFEASVANDVSPAAAQQLRLLDRTQEAQNLLILTQKLVALGSTPLTSSQGSQLVQILASASPSFQSGGQVNPAEIDWDNAINQAAGILSEGQLRAFKAAEEKAVRLPIAIDRFRSQQSGNPETAPHPP